MKTMNFNYRLFSVVMASLLGSFFLFSCSSDGDTTKPTIVLNAPAEGAVLKIGDEHGIHFDMQLSDDEGVSSYQVDIHPNFNNHGHGRAEEGSTVDFELKRSWDVGGLKNALIHHHDIKIPANATPGKYHFLVICTDVSGNQSSTFRNIVLDVNGESGED